MGFIEESDIDTSDVSTGGSFISPEELDPELTAGQKFAGGIANMVPFSVGDEAMAGIRSVFDAVKGEPIGDAYSRNLGQIRTFEKAFKNEHPILDITSQIAGTLPVAAAVPSPVVAAEGFAPTALALAGEGAAYGGASGFGAGEGLRDRLEKGTSGAKIGALANLILGGAGEGLSKILGKTSDDTLKMALDVQRSDLQKAAKFAPRDAESPLLGAIRGADERGVFSVGDDGAAFVSKNEDQIEKIGEKVSSLLKSADDVQKDVVLPKFSKAEEFVSNNPFQQEGLQKQLDNRLDTLNQSWDGTVSGLNKLKQKLYKIAYKGTTESKELDQAIASDLRSHVEKLSESLIGKKGAEEIAALNRLQGEHLTIRDLLSKLKAKDEMPGGAALALRRMAVSPIGGAAAGGLYGLYSGDPKGVLYGAAAGLGATRGGQLALSRLAGQGASVFSNASARALIPALAANESLNQAMSNTGGEMDAQAEIPRNLLTPPAIMESAKQTSGISDALLDAVKKQESGGNPKAVSKAGAKGAYQFLNSTGLEYHKKLGIKEPYDPFNETQQRKLARAYLEDLLKMFNGDLDLALAAYNAGPGRVGKILKDGESFDDIKSKLPSETQAYVPRIRSVFDKA